MIQRQDLKCSGSTAIVSGQYENVRASGALTVEGTLDCRTLHTSGATKIRGTLICAENSKTSGALKIDGAASVGSLHASGSVAVGGKMDCNGELHTSGTLTVGETLTAQALKASGNVQCNELHASAIETSGTLSVRQGVEAESFSCTGKLEIGGLLNAERVEIAVSTSNSVGDIGGGTITVRKNWYGLSFGAHRPRLNVTSIEGDTISLESTKAEIVRGKTVRIGKDCEIGRVEYTGSFTADDGTVAEAVKI